MPKLAWDQVGERKYETGVDRGVLYLADNSGVPWNGLVSVEESGSDRAEPIYIDGVKYRDMQPIGDYSATLRAITYPDEFMEFDGIVSLGQGLYVGDQHPRTFGLSFRTLVGNDLDSSEHGYKVHILYNLTAIPESKQYSTLSDSPTPTEFAWTIAGVPEHVEGYRPTAHAYFDSTRINRFFLQEVEDILYGTATTEPRLPSLPELVDIANAYQVIVITNHGDGTWSATGPDELVYMTAQPDTFRIDEVTAVYLSEDTYDVSST